MITFITQYKSQATQDFLQMTLLLTEKSEVAKIKKNLQADLNSLAEWEAQLNMSFHPGKCQVLQVFFFCSSLLRTET